MTAEFASAFQNVQIGKEAVAGTLGDAHLLLQSFSIEPAIKPRIKTFRATGQKFNTFAMPGMEHTEAKINGFMTYTEMLYLFSSALILDTPDADTASYIWILTPSNSAADTVATFSVEKGDATRTSKFAYGVVTDLNLVFSPEGCSLTGTMIGTQTAVASTDMTGTPVTIATIPILPEDVSIKYATTQAGIAGATALTRVLRCTVNISGRFAPIFALQALTNSFVAPIEKAPKIETKLLMEADAAGVVLLPIMRAGTEYFLNINALSAEISSGVIPYQFNLCQAVYVTNISEFRDEDGVYAVEYTLETKYNSTWTHGIEAKFHNALASLVT